MGVTIIETNQNTTEFARMLRKEATSAERVLWQYLQDRNLEGFKFRRQQPLGKYIVDFVNFEANLIIELDGGHHAEEEDLDKIRDE